MKIENKNNLFAKLFAGVLLLLVLTSVFVLSERTGVDVGSLGSITSSDASKIAKIFDRADFNLDGVRRGKKPVPRLFVEKMPKDIAKIGTQEFRENLFMRIVLPLVLKVNEEILIDRKKLESLNEKMKAKEDWSKEEGEWFYKQAEYYKVETLVQAEDAKKEVFMNELLKRIDAISPSLAIIQSSIESDWGSSRFTQNGNSLFGKWIWDGTGMPPKGRPEGMEYGIQSFPDLISSVREYAYDLNSDKINENFRYRRSLLRKREAPYGGHNLSAGVVHYNNRGMEYVYDIRDRIKERKLLDLDMAVLASEN